MLTTKLLQCAAPAAVLALAALIPAALTPAWAAPLGQTDQPIKIAINEWTGQHLTAHIAGSILERMGYQVEYVTAGTLPQFTGLASGTLSINPEVWPGNLGEFYPVALAEKKLAEIGELGLAARDGWMYTAATKEACPGLPDWHALTEPACVQALATAETFPNGRLLDYPADWGTASVGQLRNAGIPFTAVPAGSEGALVAELQAATATGKPLLMRFWAPHWVLAEVPVEWLEMPPCDPANRDECIVVPPVIKVVWSGFAETWPAGFAVMQALQVTADEQQRMTLAVDQQGQPLDAVVAAWMEQNQPRWEAWVADAQK